MNIDTPKTIGQRLRTIYIGVALAILLPSLTLFIWQARQTILDQTGVSLHSLSEANAQRLSTALLREVGLLRSLSNDEVFFTRITLTSETLLGPLSADERNDLLAERAILWEREDSPLQSSVLLNAASVRLKEFQNSFPIYEKLLVVDRYGALVAAAEDSPPADYLYEDARWWQVIDKSRTRFPLYVGEPYAHETEDGVLLPISVPIYASNTQVVRGVLYVLLRLDSLEMFSNLNLPGETSHLVVTNGNGRVVYGSDMVSVGEQIDIVDVMAMNQVTVWRWDGIDMIARTADVSTDRLAGAQDLIQPINWQVVTMQSQSEALAPVRRMTQLSLVGGFVILLAGLLVGQQASRSLEIPIKGLTDTVQDVLEGDLTRRAHVSGPAEVETLARGFNSMTDRLQALIDGLEGRVRERTNQLETLIRSSKNLNAILDLDRLVNELADEVVRNFGYDRVDVFLLDEKGDRLVRLNDTADDNRNMQIDIHAPDSLLAKAVRRGEVLTQQQVTPEGPQEEAAVPIIHNKRTMGAIYVMRGGNLAAEKDADLLLSMANHLAVALSNAQLFNQIQDALYETHLLLQSAHEILGETEVAAICTNAGRYVRELVQPDRFVIWLLDQESDQIEFAHEYPSAVTNVDYDELMQGLARQVLETAEPVISNSPDDGLEPAATYDRRVREGAWHVMIVPLVLNREVIGNITAINRRESRPFTERDMELLGNIATEATAAIENARLFEELQQMNAHLDQMVQTRTGELRDAYELLARLDTTKDNFIQVIAHELRTPLTKIKMSFQMLGALSTGNSDTQSLLAGGLKGVEKLYTIVNDMLDISRLDYDLLENHADEVVLEQIVNRVVRTFGDSLRERKIDLQVMDLSDLPILEGSTDLLYKLCYHLVVNAIKYTPDGGAITIKGTAVQLDRDRPGVQLSVVDTGIGIDETEIDLIFEKFYQTGQIEVHSTGETKFKGGGPGIGLALAKGIVEVHGGRIWAESEGYDEEACPGTTFYVELPLSPPAPPQPVNRDEKNGEPIGA